MAANVPPSPEGEIYTMQALMGFKKDNDKDYFWVKWEGYPDSENTWEPVENILNPSPDIEEQMKVLREKFMEKKRKRKRVAAETIPSKDLSKSGSLEEAKTSSARPRGRPAGSPNRRKIVDSQAETENAPSATKKRRQQQQLKAGGSKGVVAPDVVDQEVASLEAVSGGVSPEVVRGVGVEVVKGVGPEVVEGVGPELTGGGEANSKDAAERSKSETAESQAEGRGCAVEILTFLVNPSDGAGLLSQAPLDSDALKAVKSPDKVLVQIVRGGCKELLGLEDVREQYPLKLLDFMLKEVHFYRAKGSS